MGIKKGQEKFIDLQEKNRVAFQSSIYFWQEEKPELFVKQVCNHAKNLARIQHCLAWLIRFFRQNRQQHPVLP